MTTFLPKPKLLKIITGIALAFLLLSFFPLGGSTSFLRSIGLQKVNASFFFITRLYSWLCVILIWLYAIKIEKQPLLLWEEKKQSLKIYILSILSLFGIIFAGMLFIQAILHFTHLNNKSNVLSNLVIIFRQNKWLMLFTAITAGVTEELIFRGYLLTRLELLFKNTHVAIFISSILFGLLHLKYGTVFNVLGPFFIGLVFAYHYKYFKNIKIIILCHFLWDIMAMLILVNKH
jgi:membrane protease YdiL (CAAX protease family)